MIVLAIALAAAATAPADLPGIWEGTVGTLPVRACFVHREWQSFGAYYYLSRLRLIPLEAEGEAGDAFREGSADEANAPRWRIEGADASSLTGRWTQRGRTLPVRLRRVARIDDEDGACASPAFHQPRLAGVRTVTARGSVEGVAYTRLILNHGGRFDASVETFALDGTGAALGRVNAALRHMLDGNPPEWLECTRLSLSHSPNEGGLDHRLVPTMIARRWLSVAEQDDSFCGGAHPNSGQTDRTFDLAEGREIDLLDWFNATAVQRERLEGMDEEVKTLRPALRAVVLAGWRAPDADCGEVVRSAEYWNIGLRRGGFVFSPSLPHVVQACGDEFVLPFDRLRPFLTEEGAANVGAFRAEPRR